jgi:DNA-binding NarL/FixJ family response regulator
VEHIRILVADDHPLIRSGIRSLLERVSGIQIVAEAGDGSEALNLIRQHQPDVVLMDIEMPLMNGPEVAGLVAKEFPKVKVIILSMHEDEEYVRHALQAGAVGYLAKSDTSSEVETALRVVASGRTYLSPAVSGNLIGYVRRARGETLRGRLTPRQRQVLQLIAEGHATKRIALTLNISVKTVESHRSELMDRLDIHDIAGLVRYALRVGLIQLGD